LLQPGGDFGGIGGDLLGSGMVPGVDDFAPSNEEAPVSDFMRGLFGPDDDM
jgi:hypothetical protein